MLVSVTVFLFCTGCTAGGRGKIPETEMLESTWEDEITIMQVDAGNANFEDYIEQTEKELHMKMLTPGMRKFLRCWQLETFLLMSLQ